MKLDLDTLVTVPDDPPAAGPERALEPPPPDPGPPAEPLLAGAELLLAVPLPLLAVALTIPYEPPATAMAAAPTTMDLVSLRENICRKPFVGAMDPRVAADAGTAMEAARKVAQRLPGTRWCLAEA